jgi:amino acid transporter
VVPETEDPLPRVDPHLEVRERRKGRRPGDAYVRIVRPFEEEFERGQNGHLVATRETLLDHGGWQHVVGKVRAFLIGRPISSELEEHERLTKTKALAVFSSDNISSSAYATEEMMRVLVVAGAGAFSLVMPLTIVIAAVLAIVATSYRQTIRAYPQGASSYIVASDNLGAPVGLVAAAALLIDYTLTVAVSVSAGVAAITSIVPALFDERVLIAVVVVVVLTLGNLRGVRESGSIFMAPTYLYIVTVLGLIGYGLLGVALGFVPDYHPPRDWVAAEIQGAVQPLALLLVLRAFSSGAVALTGVEAISDGVPAFKPPEWRNARTTLTWAAVLFATLFVGISLLVSVLGILPDPSEEQTVLSILARHLTGDGWYLVLVQVATATVLTLAANTSFADFPRLSSFLARDGFMPRQFAYRGDRLAFTTGIVALALVAIALLVAFSASVTALIPLYTLGVFVAFTLSQSGMVTRWWQRREPGWRRGMLINGLGAATTAVIALIVAVSKFLGGAWLVMIMIPGLVVLMLAIRHHYRSTERAVEARAVALPLVRAPLVVVPIARLDRPSLEALAFARSIAPDPVAVHVTNLPETVVALRAQWAELGGGAELVIVESPYRALLGPLVRYLDALQRQDPGRRLLVVLSEVVPRHWWDNLLHNQTSLRLKFRLFFRPGIVVADVPYHLPR